MKFSKKWLESFIGKKISTDELIQKLTSVGLEVEGYLDDVIEVNITPNRGDCLSILGLAREVAVLLEVPFKSVDFLKIKKVKETHQDLLKINLDDLQSCPVYAGRIIKKVNVIKETPDWIKDRLKASEIGLISPAVDITNYVMLELGQPMHAFDLDKLNGGLNVRNSKQGEKIKLLNEQEIELDDNTLVIADQEKPVAIAGVMGGLESAVGGNTKSIFLESAFFDPIKIRKTVQKYNIHTDSSYRFERGVDFNLQVDAMNRATELLVEIVGGEVGPILLEKKAGGLPKIKPIIFRKSRIEKILGIKIDSEKIEKILINLQMQIKKTEKDCWEIIHPSFRMDLEIEEDFVEEIARIIGYDFIPAKLPKGELKFNSKEEKIISEIEIKNIFAHIGYYEAISYSFIDEKLNELFLDKEKHEQIYLSNPISQDMAVMRSSIVPSLLNAVKLNQHRQIKNIKLFEIGLVFNKNKSNNKVEQNKMLSCILTAEDLQKHWDLKVREADFYDLKGDLEAIFNKVLTLNGEKNIEINYKVFDKNFLHEGQSAAIYKNNEYIGFIGAIHPKIIAKLDLTGKIFVFEVDFNKLVAGVLPKFKSLSKFPVVKRDLAIVLDENQKAGDILKEIKIVAGENLSNLNVFDVYQGKGLEKNKKSIAINLFFQNDKKTLTDLEINTIIENVMSKLKEKFEATLR